MRKREGERGERGEPANFFPEFHRGGRGVITIRAFQNRRLTGRHVPSKERRNDGPDWPSTQTKSHFRLLFYEQPLRCRTDGRWTLRTSFEHFLLAKIRTERGEIVISVSWFYLPCSAHDLTRPRRGGERLSDSDRGLVGAPIIPDGLDNRGSP